MAYHQDDVPSWLSEDCPQWCTRLHTESDHLEDRIHQGDPAFVHVRLRDSSLLTDHDPGRPIELLIRAMRAVGAPHSWVQITPPDDISRSVLIGDSSLHLLTQALLAQPVGRPR